MVGIRLETMQINTTQFKQSTLEKEDRCYHKICICSI